MQKTQAEQEANDAKKNDDLGGLGGVTNTAFQVDEARPDGPASSNGSTNHAVERL